MKLLPLLLFLSFFAKAQAPFSNFSIHGAVDYSSDRYIYFAWYNEEEKRFTDSAWVHNGKFNFKGYIDGYVDRFYVKSDLKDFNNNDSVNNVQMPTDNSVMQLNLKVGQFSKYLLTGCVSCDNLAKSKLKKAAYTLKSEAYKNFIEDSLTIPAEKEKYEALHREIELLLLKRDIDWCKDNPNDNLSPYYLAVWNRELQPYTLKKMFENLDSFQQNSFYGKRVQQIIEYNNTIDNQINSRAIFFERVGFDGNVVNLETLVKNNYVLLDFWTSWCSPCRASHPELICLFNKYLQKDLQLSA